MDRRIPLGVLTRKGATNGVGETRHGIATDARLISDRPLINGASDPEPQRVRYHHLRIARPEPIREPSAILRICRRTHSPLIETGEPQAEDDGPRTECAKEIAAKRLRLIDRVRANRHSRRDSGRVARDHLRAGRTCPTDRQDNAGDGSSNGCHNRNQRPFLSLV